MRNLGVVLAFISLVNEVWCLRVSELRISPPAVQRGESAALQCLYDLQGAPLYCVKWYRGRHEFYRYSPADTPKNKIFPFSGINVDLATSNATQVSLQRVDFALTGNFSCEVSADAPSFSTAVSSGHMEVVSIPQGVPVIVSENSLYHPGDILRANCTAPPARPRANISLYINDMQIGPGQLRQRDVERGLFQGQLAVSLQLLPEHFSGGPPVLKCTASILHLYAQAAELQLRSSRAAPRIERVTSNGCAETDASVSSLVIMLFYYFIYISANMYKYS